MATKTYRVTVPSNIRSGESFYATIDRESYSLTCPADCKEGSVLEVKVIKPNESTRMNVGGNNTESQTQTTPLAAFFLTLCLIVFIVTTLSYSLTPYAQQNISNECSIIYGSNGRKITKLYYFLYDGLSSSPNRCVNKPGQFCVSWSKDTFWTNFESSVELFTARPTAASGNTSRDWSAAQVLIPLGSGMTFLGILTLLITVFYRPTMSLASYYSGLSWVGLFVLVNFILLTSAFNVTIVSSSTSPSSWIAYYTDLFQNGNPDVNTFPIVVTSNPQTGCSVSILYTNGGSLLASALSLSFITTIAILCLSCWGAWSSARAMDNQALYEYRAQSVTRQPEYVVIVE